MFKDQAIDYEDHGITENSQEGTAGDDAMEYKINYLLIATKHGNIETVEALLRAKADVKAVDKDGKTALQIATEKGYTGIVEKLLKAGGGAAGGEVRKDIFEADHDTDNTEESKNIDKRLAGRAAGAAAGGVEGRHASKVTKGKRSGAPPPPGLSC